MKVQFRNVKPFSLLDVCASISHIYFQITIYTRPSHKAALLFIRLIIGRGTHNLFYATRFQGKMSAIMTRALKLYLTLFFSQRVAAASRPREICTPWLYATRSKSATCARAPLRASDGWSLSISFSNLGTI